MLNIEQILQETLGAVWARLAEFSPRLLAALVLLLGGWLIAKLLRRAAIRVFRALQFDVVAEKAGIEDFLLRGGIRFTAVTLLANLVYWVLLFTVTLAALHVLGLDAAAELINRVILYLPNVVIAVLVLLFGSLLGKFVRGASFAYLSNVGIEGAAFLSHVAQWAIMIFVASVALEQLQIGGQVLVSAFQIAFGAFCLAMALAFGLGGRRWAAHILDRMWKGRP